MAVVATQLVTLAPLLPGRRSGYIRPSPVGSKVRTSMIGFWISAGAMLAMVALVLLQGLKTGPLAQGLAVSEDLTVYRDQLAEVERDLARGTLGPSDADRLRIEVQRRMLDADRMHSGQQVMRPSANYAVASVVVVLALAGAAGLYWTLGAPGYPDVPLSDRMAFADAAYQHRLSQGAAEAAQPPYVQPADVDPDLAAMIDKLRTAVATRPDDLLGHTLLAQNEAALGNFVAARTAQEVVVRLKGDAATAEDLSHLAFLMITASGGIVTPQAEQALIGCLRIDPRNGWARFYSGLMFAQIGRPDRTFGLWEPLLREGPQTAPWIAPIRDRIEAVASAAGINFALRAPTPGPGAAAVAAASEMSVEDRQAMIKTMVGGLEARLATDGGSVEEWAKLITSLGVLQEPDRAKTAYEKATAAFAGKPGELAALQAAAVQAGIAK
jgi:cytochrome c-type biogenesis protein CcmH